MPEVSVGLMTPENIDAVYEIETASFSLPWSREALLKEVTENKCARYLVLSEDGVPVAYAGVWFVLDEGHITNIAVRPGKRRKGYGERITAALIQLAADSGMSFLTLECRRSNEAAQAMYHKLGFIDVGYRKRYYQQPTEDGLVMLLEPLPEGNPENDPYLIAEE